MSENVRYQTISKLKFQVVQAFIISGTVWYNNSAVDNSTADNSAADAQAAFNIIQVLVLRLVMKL